MGSPLGPLMANVIMTKLELVVVKDLFNKGYLKFYIRYMDDTLVLMKKSPMFLQFYKHFIQSQKSTFLRSFDRQKYHRHIL